MNERRHTVLEDKSYEGVEHRNDPSLNVLKLVADATKYLEEMHKASDIFYDKKLEQSQAFLDEKLRMAVETSQRERATETARVNDLREGDKKNVDIASERAIKQAELLAKQVTDNTETFRSAMAEQAKANTAMIQQVTASLDARLKLVEDNQRFISGNSKGNREMYGWIAGGLAMLLMVVNFFWDKF